MEHKECQKCGNTKLLAEFYYRKDNKRFRTVCKVCWNASVTAWKLEHPDRVKQYYHRYNHSDKNEKNQQRYYENNHEYKLWAGARTRANKHKLPFSLLVEDVVIPPVCPVLGIELKYNTKCVQSTSATIDRIIPEMGYVKENIQIMSHKANAMKNNATPEELLAFAKWVIKVYG